MRVQKDTLDGDGSRRKRLATLRYERSQAPATAATAQRSTGQHRTAQDNTGQHRTAQRDAARVSHRPSRQSARTTSCAAAPFAANAPPLLSDAAVRRMQSPSQPPPQSSTQENRHSIAAPKVRTVGTSETAQYARNRYPISRAASSKPHAARISHKNRRHPR